MASPKNFLPLICLVLALSLVAGACSTAPYTGRRQLLFTSEGNENSMGYRYFQEVKREYRPAKDPEAKAMVNRVGQRVAAAAQRPDYRWEFEVFQDDKEANAFCLPGGKVGLFTGILKYTKDENGMATVIAHEVAHALARHAGERMSQSMLAQVGGMGLGAALGGVGGTAGSAIMQGYGLATQLGVLLPYSRTQESEADRIGLILMAKAGYDPAGAVEFWKRMQAKERGQKMPQFLSTHPSDANRIKQIEAFLPEARKYYVAAGGGADAERPRITAPPPARPRVVSGQWIR